MPVLLQTSRRRPPSAHPFSVHNLKQHRPQTPARRPKARQPHLQSQILPGPSNSVSRHPTDPPQRGRAYNPPTNPKSTYFNGPTSFLEPGPAARSDCLSLEPTAASSPRQWAQSREERFALRKFRARNEHWGRRPSGATSPRLALPRCLYNPVQQKIHTSQTVPDRRHRQPHPGQTASAP